MSASKILIVDDEPFNVDYIEQELEDTGYVTISASNGEEALDLIRSECPDLVLLDIMMPVMDGFEVLTRLKANPETRDIPVVVISASNDLKSVVKGIKLGAEDYLPKPFEPALLSARISSGLEKKHLRDMQKKYLKSLERELEIGHDIQQGFLPREIPKIERWDIAAYFKSAKEVAGDYYDIFLLPDGNLMCVIGDVCGKGVGAALYMSLFRSLIRSVSKKEDWFMNERGRLLNNSERLHSTVAYVNNYVAETHGHTSMFSTVIIAIINPLEDKLSYLNCGNEPAILAGKDGSTSLLWPTGPIVGIIPDAEFVPQEIAMKADDMLLIYTDGVTDALDPNGVSFGRERLITFVQERHINLPDCNNLLFDLQGHIHQHIGEADQFDDITIMAVRRL